MDLYLPTDFLSLRDEIDACGAHACADGGTDCDESMWLGGEAYVASSLFGDRPAAAPRREPRLHKLPSGADTDWLGL